MALFGAFLGRVLVRDWPAWVIFRGFSSFFRRVWRFWTDPFLVRFGLQGGILGPFSGHFWSEKRPDQRGLNGFQFFYF